jgi:hypothetical protein
MRSILGGRTGLLNACFMFLCLAPVRAQMLLVDRPVTGSAGSGIRLSWTKSPGFLGDTFKVGAPGEVWVIDAIRTWAIPG